MKTKKDWKRADCQAVQEELFRWTGYWFRDRMLMTQAFVRSSYTTWRGGADNEVLEWMGDSVLNSCVTKVLAQNFGRVKCPHSEDYESAEFSFRDAPQTLSVRRSQLVSNEALARMIDQRGLVEHLVVGKADVGNRVDESVKVKADLFEAILGAIAVDCKWQWTVLEQVVGRMLSLDQWLDSQKEEELRVTDITPEHAVQMLKELGERGECSVPEYQIWGPDSLGYTKDGNPRWSCQCAVSSWGTIKSVSAHSKKDAKKYAAYLVLCHRFDQRNVYDTKGGSMNMIGWHWKDGRLEVRTPEWNWDC